MTVCTFTITPSLLSPLSHQLQQGNFLVHAFHNTTAFIHFVHETRLNIDCLVVEEQEETIKMLRNFAMQDILLPAVILVKTPLPEVAIAPHTTKASGDSDEQSSLSDDKVQELLGKTYYHNAVHILSFHQTGRIASSIEQAIDAFLRLPPPPLQVSSSDDSKASSQTKDAALSLIDKQQRLSSKLQERLGYLGVFYKRNPNSFLRRMNQEERQLFLANLKEDYRDIILNYFLEHPDLNQKIDRYVTTAFLADVPTAQIVKIHMELMDEFSKQLKLEGRNEEILLDYRLTLIDTIANLCELYRRSVPRSQ